MSDLFQLAEAQESTTAFDGVNGAEYAGQKLARGWIRLQPHQLLVESVQIFATFNQKILDDIVHSSPAVLPLAYAMAQILTAAIRAFRGPPVSTSAGQARA